MRFLLLLVATLSACASTPITTSTDVVATPSGRLAAEIVRRPHDEDHHQETSKVFHHVYAPDGRLLTKGPGGRFGHHRGLFLGWNRLTANGERYDFWHCNHGETQQHRGFVTTAEHTLGPDWQVSRIDWSTADGRVVIAEQRALRARDLEDLTVIDMRAELRALADVRLAGDPQHSGQQFRALQMFAAAGGPKVDYIRPDTATGHGNDVWKQCGWIAAVLPMPEGDVTVLRIEGRGNPEPATWSTRPYGRFGATFTHAIPKGSVLTLAWTYVVANGRRDRDWCERIQARLTQTEGTTAGTQSSEGAERISRMTR